IGDRSITGLVARDQMVGPWQVPVADAAVTATSYTGYTGEAMAMGERTPVAVIDAPASGRMAIGEVITNLASSRIAKLSDIRLSANWMAAAGHPGEDQALFDTVKAVGMELCPALGITIPVGKDSMSMKTVWKDKDEQKTVVSPLSLIISGFAPVTDIRGTLTPQIRPEIDSRLLMIDLGFGKNRIGGSALAQVFGAVGAVAPDVDNPEHLRAFFSIIQTLASDKRLIAYHDRSDGGLFTTLAEMMFAGRCGISLELDNWVRDPSHIVRELFNEELGAVIQVPSEHLDAVRAAFEAAGLGACLVDIGCPTREQHLQLTLGSEVSHVWTRSELQKLWSETSYQIQRIRDNSECADQEFARIEDDQDPGLNVRLTFGLDDAPMINTGARPRAAILREQGVNGQVEMAAAFDRAGFEAVDVHMSDILRGNRTLDAFSVLAACGGFSYGDVLGAGEGWAKSILFNARAREQFEAFFLRQDTLALGVCNGCQMLSNLKSLIPGTEHWPHFVRNLSEQFEARFSLVEVLESSSVWLKGMEGSVMPVAVAHGEGRAEFRDDASLEGARAAGMVALRYVENKGGPAIAYPANPNGSPEGVTGFSSRDGRVTIMMPHPERVFRTVQWSWHPDGWGEDSPWIQLFRNARKTLD
ncbi:MAG: phosphoribosylformylglycinamidine synthase, partial [Gammaproteobacteria bacterium]